MSCCRVRSAEESYPRRPGTHVFSYTCEGVVTPWTGVHTSSHARCCQFVEHNVLHESFKNTTQHYQAAPLRTTIQPEQPPQHVRSRHSQAKTFCTLPTREFKILQGNQLATTSTDSELESDNDERYQQHQHTGKLDYICEKKHIPYPDTNTVREVHSCQDGMSFSTCLARGHMDSGLRKSPHEVSSNGSPAEE